MHLYDNFVEMYMIGLRRAMFNVVRSHIHQSCKFISFKNVQYNGSSISFIKFGKYLLPRTGVGSVEMCIPKQISTPYGLI